MANKELINELKKARYLMGITESEEKDTLFEEKEPFEEDAVFNPDDVEDEDGYDAVKNADEKMEDNETVDEGLIDTAVKAGAGLVKKAVPLVKKSGGLAKKALGTTTGKVAAAGVGASMAGKAISDRKNKNRNR